MPGRSPKPQLPDDFRDMLSAFQEEGVEYLLVGGHALAAQGHVRSTKDMDLWIRRSAENAGRVLRALERFGAPKFDVTDGDFESPDLIYQIGVPPHRIDIITQIKGVNFDEAWPQRLTWEKDGLAVPDRSRAPDLQ